MDILLLGSGGREHALACALRKSKHCGRLYFSPGHAAAEDLGESAGLSLDDFDGIAEYVRERSIEMVIVGPEQPLVDGIVDHLKKETSAHLIGPNARTARLEGSKTHAKAFMQRHNIPTVRHKSFSAANAADALSFLRKLSPPYVVKADGLAGGKGVRICNTTQEAERYIHALLHEGKHGEAGHQILIEEHLQGEELSFFVLMGQNGHLYLPTARDYKRAGNGNTGPNTGGMGAFSPGLVGQATHKRIVHSIVLPTLRGLRAEDMSYNGFLFFGLMIVAERPYVLEYNVRLGDPETQAIFPRIRADVVEMLMASCTGELSDFSLAVDRRKSVTLTMASAGYPGRHLSGQPITGLSLGSQEGFIFLAGAKKVHNQYYTAGGRVLMVTHLASTVGEAARRCYETASGIHWEGGYYRQDIGAGVEES